MGQVKAVGGLRQLQCEQLIQPQPIPAGALCPLREVVLDDTPQVRVLGSHMSH